MELKKLDSQYTDELVNLWNKEIGSDFPMRKELFEQNTLNDENLFKDGSWLALREGKTVGFITAKYIADNNPFITNFETGWIQTIIVDTAYRNQGVGSALLDAAENAFRQKMIEKIHLGGDLWHYFPGIPNNYQYVKNWFSKRGYIENDIVYDLVCDLTAIDLQGNGDDIKLIENEEKEEFMDFLKANFSGRWEYEANEYFNRGGTGREYAVIRGEGEILGFIRINDDDSKVIGPNNAWNGLFSGKSGGIGPLGIKESERGKGHGLKIVRAGLNVLKGRQVKLAVIDWTEKVEFYKKAGADPWKSYSTRVKKL